MGLGYVGLPLAISFKSKGFDVWGFDIDEKRIDLINQGKFPFPVESENIGVRFKATTNPKECLPSSDYVIICVPTPLKGDNIPDVSYIEEASKTIKKFLKTGMTIILESTTYPGTTDEIVKPILEESGLKAGKDFYLGYSPERINPGDKKYPVEKIPKIVSGVNDQSLKKVKELYDNIIEKTIPVKNMKTAEAVKIVENVFRNVNISLVNELAILFEKMGIDTYEVINAASTKPFGFMPFYPGPGVGGHCIPVDPFYLSWKAKDYGVDMKFIELAGIINQMMPLHVVELIEKNADKKKKVLILGVSFKKNISDARNTPAKKIVSELKRRGYKFSYFDPYIKNFEGLESEKSLEYTVKDSDCVVLVTDHDQFRNISGLDGKLVIDTRNFFKNPVGRKYVGLGK